VINDILSIPTIEDKGAYSNKLPLSFFPFFDSNGNQSKDQS